MSSADIQRQPGGVSADVRADRTANASATLAAIDRTVFPESKEIPFYEQSVLIKRAVTRLFGHG